MPRPFDLEKAKAGAPLVTRDGIKVLAFHDSGLDVLYPCTGYFENSPEPRGWKRDGSYTSSHEHCRDLFLADPPKVKNGRYVFLYKLPNGNVLTNQKNDHEAMAREWCEICKYTFLGGALITWEEDAP